MGGWAPASATEQIVIASIAERPTAFAKATASLAVARLAAARRWKVARYRSWGWGPTTTKR
jgi:hypothetical protein